RIDPGKAHSIARSADARDKIATGGVPAPGIAGIDAEIETGPGIDGWRRRRLRAEWRQQHNAAKRCGSSQRGFWHESPLGQLKPQLLGGAIAASCFLPQNGRMSHSGNA